MRERKREREGEREGENEDRLREEEEEEEEEGGVTERGWWTCGGQRGSGSGDGAALEER